MLNRIGISYLLYHTQFYFQTKKVKDLYLIFFSILHKILILPLHTSNLTTTKI